MNARIAKTNKNENKSGKRTNKNKIEETRGGHVHWCTRGI